MKKSRILLAALAFMAMSNQAHAQKKKDKVAEAKPKDNSFSFVALGDMPYNLPQDYVRFENVIKTVNEQNQVFSVFVGDIKASVTPCTEDVYLKMFNYFNQFKKPLIYTPGDNEWTDCSKKEAGAYDPENRLEAIRKMFFKDTVSFGTEKMGLHSQASQKGFEKYVENYSWSYKNIGFATIHIVGTNNYFLPDSRNHNEEFFGRDSANIVWLKTTFENAKKMNFAGLVIFEHGDMFNDGKTDIGFKNFVAELKKQVLDFGKPVLMVNGDSHEYLVDKPLQKMPKVKNAIPNFTRLQVFGENEMHAVKITINPTNPTLFQIEQLIVPGN